MSEVKPVLENLSVSKQRSPQEVNEDVAQALEAAGYTIALHDYERPWGGFNQLINEDADRFVAEFFPGITPEEARLGNPGSPLSPKILVVAPEQRLSWQYHNLRAERWVYLTKGAFFKSIDDDQGNIQQANPGDVVQFQKSERHRLVGAPDRYTLVAEIWQHVDPTEPSNENDIVRLADDYKR